MIKTLIERVIVAVYEANSYGSSLSDDEAEAAIRAVLQEMHSKCTVETSQGNGIYLNMVDISYFIQQFAKENGIEL